MPNFWSITTQKIAEAFSGPRTKDDEFDQKMEEMKTIEKSILNLKSILQNYVSSTSGIKNFSREFHNSIKVIYDRNSSYGTLGNDIADTHAQIERAYEDLVANINELNISTSEWTTLFNAAKSTIVKREESRKVYDHYDEKMEKLYRSRHEKIKKNLTEAPKETELISRNESKYKQATETYISLSTSAYHEMCIALDYRYTRINPVVSKFIECENKFYQNIYNAFRMMDNIENKFNVCNRKFERYENSYDPTKYIRGGDLIKPQIEINKNKRITEELDRVPTKSNHNNNGPYDAFEFQENESKKQMQFNRNSSVKQPFGKEHSNEQAVESEDFNNPYAQISFKNIQNTYFGDNNRLSQAQPLQNRNTYNNNNYSQNNNPNNFSNNNFDFTVFNNNIPTQQRLQNSKTVVPMSSNNQTGLIDYSDLNNINQAATDINNGIKFYQNNKETIHQGYNFYQNNQQQINQGISQGYNFYQNNQQTINSIAKHGPNPMNQCNQSKNKNNDIFQDFFK